MSKVNKEYGNQMVRILLVWTSEESTVRENPSPIKVWGLTQPETDSTKVTKPAKGQFIAAQPNIMCIKSCTLKVVCARNGELVLQLDHFTVFLYHSAACAPNEELVLLWKAEWEAASGIGRTASAIDSAASPINGQERSGQVRLHGGRVWSRAGQFGASDFPTH